MDDLCAACPLGKGQDGWRRREASHPGSRLAPLRYGRDRRWVGGPQGLATGGLLRRVRLGAPAFARGRFGCGPSLGSGSVGGPGPCSAGPFRLRARSPTAPCKGGTYSTKTLDRFWGSYSTVGSGVSPKRSALWGPLIGGHCLNSQTGAKPGHRNTIIFATGNCVALRTRFARSRPLSRCCSQAVFGSGGLPGFLRAPRRDRGGTLFGARRGPVRWEPSGPCLCSTVQ